MHRHLSQWTDWRWWLFGNWNWLWLHRSLPQLSIVNHEVSCLCDQNRFQHLHQIGPLWFRHWLTELGHCNSKAISHCIDTLTVPFEHKQGTTFNQLVIGYLGFAIWTLNVNGALSIMHSLPVGIALVLPVQTNPICHIVTCDGIVPLFISSITHLAADTFVIGSLLIKFFVMR